MAQGPSNDIDIHIDILHPVPEKTRFVLPWKDILVTRYIMHDQVHPIRSYFPFFFPLSNLFKSDNITNMP